MLIWVRDGKPLRLESKTRRRAKSALELAVETGFYSMVRMLLTESIWSDEELEHALHDAVWNRREDMVALLVEKGAPIDGISFYSVFRSMDSGLINRFLELGLDPCANNAFAKILNETKAKPLLRFFKEHREKYPGLEDQMAMSLVEAIDSKNVRWSALLLWAGADLHREVPYNIKYDPSVDDAYKVSAMDTAISQADLDFLEALKIKPSPELRSKILDHAAYSPGKPAFRSLLKQMSSKDLNTGDHGSCPALESLVDRHRYNFSYGGQSEDQREEEALKAIDALLSAGAKWLPSNEKIRYTRRALLSHDGKYIVQVVRMLLYTEGTTTMGHIHELCRTGSISAKITSADRQLWKEILALTSAGNSPKN
jgi:hypothetical protein